MARIAVAGYMVRHPVAGNVLAYFHYILGLARLGHDVLYVEESGWPYSCYDPGDRQWHDYPDAGLRVARDLVSRYRLAVPICYVNRDRRIIDGVTWPELETFLRDCDLLLNIGGVCWLPEFDLCRRRALVDLDPFFTQIDRFGARILGNYHVLFTYGANIGRPGCTVPTAGFAWFPTVPPVVADEWRADPPPAAAPVTTVANWSAYGSVLHDGREFGQKDREFERLIDLPRRSTLTLELAISGADEPTRDRFRQAGWTVRDAGEEVSTDVDTYRRYLLGSRAELSAAKHAYVKTWSGWFSDRSVCYLAAGRPVVLQDTGFSNWLPTGRGVLAFSTADEAAEHLHRLERDDAVHRTAAVDLARAIFGHDVVLPGLLQTCEAAASAAAAGRQKER